MAGKGLAAVAVRSLTAAAGCGSGGGTAQATGVPSTTVGSSAPSTTVITAAVPAGTYSKRVTRAFPVRFRGLATDDPPGPEYLSFGAGSLWVGFHRSHAVRRVNPATGEVIATIAIDPTPGSIKATNVTASGAGTGTGSVLATDDGVWVLDTGGFVWRIDPDTNAI